MAGELGHPSVEDASAPDLEVHACSSVLDSVFSAYPLDHGLGEGACPSVLDWGLNACHFPWKAWASAAVAHLQPAQKVVRAESQGLSSHQAAPVKVHLGGGAAVYLVLRLLRWVVGVGPFDRPLQSEVDFLEEVFDRLITGKVFSHRVDLVFFHRPEDEVFCPLKAKGLFHLTRLEVASHRAEEAVSCPFHLQEGALTAAYQAYRAIWVVFGRVIGQVVVGEG